MGGVLPPYGRPAGAEAAPGELVRLFVGGAVEGFSPDLHVEGPVLLAERTVALALRLTSEVVLVRTDLPDGLDEARELVEQELTRLGLACVDESTLFGPAVALQVLGLRLSTWDLWAADLDAAFAALRAAAVGAEDAPVFLALAEPFEED